MFVAIMLDVMVYVAHSANQQHIECYFVLIYLFASQR